MPANRDKQQTFQLILFKWFPVILTGILLFTVPPAAIAVIIAYFTAPILVVATRHDKTTFNDCNTICHDANRILI